jgi:hypothetical protein
MKRSTPLGKHHADDYVLFDAFVRGEQQGQLDVWPQNTMSR